MLNVWPHPKHVKWAICGTIFQFLALILALIGAFGSDWFETKGGDKYGLFDDKITCYTEFCSTKPVKDGEKSGWPGAAGALFIAGVGINAVGFISVACVFWPLTKKKVMIIIPKVAMFLHIVGAYLKYAGCWVAVSNMTTANMKRLLQKPDADVEVNTTSLGFVFTSFCFEIFAIATLKTAVDVGLKKGPTHLERLQEEEEEKAESLSRRQSQRKSVFNVDTHEAHEEILSRASHLDVTSRGKSVTSKHSYATTTSARISTAQVSPSNKSTVAE